MRHVPSFPAAWWLVLTLLAVLVPAAGPAQELVPAAGRSQEDDARPRLALDAGGHTDRVQSAVFTPDGRELITASDDKTIRFWDVETGEAVRTLRPPIGDGYEGMLYVAAVSSDGRTLAVAGYGPGENRGTIYLISLTRYEIERTLKGHTRGVLDLAFSPDGRRLLSGAGDNTARVWNVSAGTCEAVLEGHTAVVQGVAFSPDGRRCATASFDKTTRIWDLAGRNLGTPPAAQVLQGHRAEVKCVAWSPDGKRLATGSYDHSVRLWDVSHAGKAGLLKTLDNLGARRIVSVAFTTDSQRLLYTQALGSGPYAAGLIDLATGRQLVQFGDGTNTFFRGSLSPDGRLAATSGGDDNETWLWRTSDGSAVRKLVGRGRTVYSAAWSPDGAAIAWGNTNQGASQTASAPLEKTFDLTRLEPSVDHAIQNTPWRRAVFSQGSLTLQSEDNASGGDAGVAVRRGAQTVATLGFSSSDHNFRYNRVRSFTFLPGDRAAVGTIFGLFLFDTRTGKEVRRFVGHAGVVWAVAPSPDGRYVLSAGNDMTLRVWAPDRDRPLLNLFFAGDEWVAWTPEGYYAASAGGERLMGWHVNNGPDKLATFHPAAQFRKALYRPDVIKLLLKTGSTERALEVANKALGKDAKPTTAEQVLPPKVRITAPQAGTLPQAEVTITAVAESRGNHPITAFKLVLDGQALPGKTGTVPIDPPKVGTVEARWTVTLSPGRHRLQALAESPVSQGASPEVEVAYTQQELQLRKPRLVLLAVGVSKYQHPSVGKLDYAASDAKAVTDTFAGHSKELFRDAAVKLLRDDEATRDNILDGLDWLQKETTQDDYVVLFFAGHGEVDPTGMMYVLPVAADRERLRRTAVAGDELLRTFRNLPPSKRMLILDACHAGAVGQAGKKRSGGSVTDDLVRELLTPENGVVVMCSSTGREFSQESHQHRMGVFTRALTEGLSGQGPKDKEGLVFTHHLHSYVCDRVKELTKGEQHPIMKNPDEIRSFPVSKPRR